MRYANVRLSRTAPDGRNLFSLDSSPPTHLPHYTTPTQVPVAYLPPPFSLPLSPRPGDATDPHAELLAHDVGEARLAEARRADEERHVGGHRLGGVDDRRRRDYTA